MVPATVSRPRSPLSLMDQFAMSSQNRWRRLRGFRRLADVIAGVKFIDGVNERDISTLRTTLWSLLGNSRLFWKATRMRKRAVFKLSSPIWGQWRQSEPVAKVRRANCGVDKMCSQANDS